MTRDQHLKAIYITGTRKLGKNTVLVMLCSGPDCGGAEMLARINAYDVTTEANTHIDKMADLHA
jgi:hypothetical protein